MDNINNIVSLQKPRFTPLSHSPANSQGQQDLLGFISQIVQQAKTNAKNDIAPTASSAAATQRRELAEKIAHAIQKSDAAPAALKKMPTKQLADKIDTLLQKKDNDTGAVKPALTSDLAAGVSTQIQDNAATDAGDILQQITDLLQTNKTASATDLAKILDQLQAGSSDTKEIQKILEQLQAQQNDVSTALDPAVFQQLKDKITEFLAAQGTGILDKEALAQFKADLTQFLKDQGLDEKAAEGYVAALEKLLKHSDTNNAAAADPVTAALSAAQQGIATKTHTAHTDSKTAANTPAPSTFDVKNLISSDTKQQNAQQPAEAGWGQRTDEAVLRAQSAAALSTSAPAPAQQPTVTAKIAGFGVSPHMINALAQSDGGFSAGGFGAGMDGQPHAMTANAALLKPASVDSLNAQNFTNYLSSARGPQSAVTQMVNVQLQRNINAKVDTMTFQLTPLELGRMEIKLKFAKDGSVKAHMTVDKPETLALLQKDAHHLEKVLQQTGLNADGSSLSFDLRQQSQHQNLEGFNGGRRNGADELSNPANNTDNALQARIAVQSNGYITSNGVNIVV